MKKFLLSMVLIGISTTLVMAYGNGDRIDMKYTSGSSWSGIVYETSKNSYKLKIVEVNAGWTVLWFNPSRCTGGEKISSSSIGDFVWIPKDCVE